MPGAYEGFIVLGDSLEIDRNYELSLLSEKSDKKLLSNNFNLEDYQLDETSYSFEAKEDDYIIGQDVLFTLEGKDANGFNLLDSRVNIVVTTAHVIQFESDSLFIPDTIWTKTAALDPIGHTQLSIPDSIFAEATVRYKATATFNNSNNETHVERLFFSRKQTAEVIDFNAKGDSLYIQFLERGKEQIREAQLYNIKGEDTLSSKLITLPYALSINPLVSQYLVKTESVKNVFFTNSIPHDLNLLFLRKKDSIQLFLHNPRHLSVKYAIYKGQKKLIQEGETDHLSKLIIDPTNASYFMNCQFMWAGKMESIRRSSHVFDKSLKIEIDQAEKIYPGQVVDVNVTVNDYKDLPLENVNLTVGAINSQFKKEGIPTVPYLGKGRRRASYFNKFYLDDFRLSQSFSIDSVWQEKLHLDTLLYYQVVYPNNGSFAYYDSSMNIENAQFAPHLYDNGVKETIHLIYIDGVLKYHSQLNHSEPFSFKAYPGYRSVRIRTRYKEYKIDSVYFKQRHKLDLSIDVNHLPKSVTVRAVGSELSTKEMNTVFNHTFFIKNSFRRNEVFIWQGNKRIYIPKRRWGGKNLYQLGPFYSDSIHFIAQNEFQTGFIFEPGYEYTVGKGLVKMKELKRTVQHKNLNRIYHNINQYLGQYHTYFPISLKSQAISWEQYLLRNYRKRPGNGTGKLQIEYKGDSVFTLVGIRLIDSLLGDRYYHGKRRQFSNLSAGVYEIVFATESGHFLYCDSINVRSNGTTFKRFYEVDLVHVDSVFKGKNTWFFECINRKNNSKLMTSIKSIASDEVLKGTLVDETTKEPLMMATVLIYQGGVFIKGTTTDFDGHYKITPINPGRYEVKFEYIGYNSKEIQDVIVSPQHTTTVNGIMSESISELGLVEIVHYKMPLINKLSYSMVRSSDDIDQIGATNMNNVVSLSAGMYQKGDGAILNARGNRTDGNVYYVDGVKMIGSEHLPMAAIEEITIEDEVLVEELEVAFDSIGEEPKMGSSGLRTKFSDYAIWQPNLITDNNGKASFKVTFPDNVTKWKTFVLAMDGQKHSGRKFAETVAMKDLMGSLSTPRFLVEGDETKVIGKIANYLPTQQKVKSSYYKNEQLVKETDTNVQHSVIEPLQLSVENKDTILVKYQIEIPNGFIDGEERKIPVFPKGVLETKGSFSVLENNKELHIGFKENELIEIYVHKNILGSLLEEIKLLEDYPYDCMEQTSSKLLAYLMKKEMLVSLNRPFKDERKLKKLIKRLKDTQNKAGGWGWWSNGYANTWMTTYVMNALNKARIAGYKVPFMSKGEKWLKWQLDLLEGNDLLSVINTLSEMRVEFPVAAYLDKLEKDTLNAYQEMMVLKIKQANKLDYSLDSMEARKHQTMFGNYYWGEGSYDWYSNSNRMTTLAYEILENVDSNHADLDNIRNYFLEIKGQNKWRNTIDKASIISTILPYYLKDQVKEVEGTRVTLSGIIDKEITEFPFHLSIKAADLTKDLRVKKMGNGTVYFTAYQKFWNAEPTKTDSLYDVVTWFEKDGKRIDSLKAGEVIEMKVNVKAKNKGQYIMIEVPIPAGCSYGNNDRNRSYNETHRAYFKNKTSIFCENLMEGNHVYTIILQPRFNGTYHLNPSTVELMYFPTFNGRNSIKKLVID